MNGYGWCVLRAQPPPEQHLGPDPDDLDADRARREADEALWGAFRARMAEVDEPFLRWDLVDQNNNDSGVLTFSVSRNHRASGVWAMLDWIAAHALGAYGLFFVHDDEGPHPDVFRVHRVRHGRVDELADPLLGPVWPDLER